MDFRAPNFGGFVAWENNDETFSNVSSIVSHEPQGPFGPNNSYMPMPTPTPTPMQQGYNPATDPLFGSNMVSHHHHQQQPNARNFAAYPTPPYNRNIGYGGESSNTNVVVGRATRAGPFSPAQLMELQNQTYIYKHIVENVPVPPHLLTQLTDSLFPHALPPLAAPHFYSSNPMRWGNPREAQGGRSDDPEPGRCRRTDGKKWRCARDAIIDNKYCERHMNRGRHRSRRVEPAHRPATATTTPTLTEPVRIQPRNSQQHLRISNPAVALSSVINRYNPHTSSLDGVVSVPSSEGQPARLIFPSDSFVDPSQAGSFLNLGDQETQDQYLNSHYIDDWSDNQPNDSAANWPDWSQLTASGYNSMPSSATLQDYPPLSPLTLPQEIDPVQIGLGGRGDLSEVTQRQNDWQTFGLGTSMEDPSSGKSSFSGRKP